MNHDRELYYPIFKWKIIFQEAYPFDTAWILDLVAMSREVMKRTMRAGKINGYHVCLGLHHVLTVNDWPIFRSIVILHCCITLTQFTHNLQYVHEMSSSVSMTCLSLQVEVPIPSIAAYRHYSRYVVSCISMNPDSSASSNITLRCENADHTLVRVSCKMTRTQNYVMCDLTLPPMHQMRMRPDRSL